MAIHTRKLKDGRTAYDVQLRRPDGTKYGRTFHVKKQAKDWEATERTARVNDQWVDPNAGRITVGAYSKEWLAHRKLAPKTRETYDSQLKHILPTFGDTALNAMTRREVRAWHRKVSVEVSELQAAKCYRLLMAMLNTAEEDDLIGKNRCRLKGAAQEHSEERPLIPLSTALALVEAMEPRYRALVVIAMSCGLRMGELMGLTRGDVDLLHRQVIVNKQKQELAKVGITVRAPKTDAGVRRPEFPKLVAPAIEAHLDEYVGIAPESPLFTGPRGGHRRASVYKAWHKALAVVGLPDDVKPHDLRHLANTLAAKTPGITVKDLMARMGHKSEAAALRYLHATNEADAAMASGIDEAMREASEARQTEADEAESNSHPTERCLMNA